MLIITNPKGRSLPLAKVDKYERKRGTNGDYEVKLIVKRNKDNADVFNLIKTESIITYGNESYRIKDVDISVVNNEPVVEAIGLHVLYDLSGYFVEDIIEGEKVLSLHQALTHALQPSDYTFIIKDEFENVSLENFGNGKSIVLFNELKQKFGFEFSVENKHIIIVKRLGNDTNTQLRWKHNIKSIKIADNTHNLATRIKGYGKPKEDEEGNIIEGEYVVQAVYESPNIDKYDRVITAEPYHNDKITHEDTLLQYLKDNLIDEPEFTVELEYDELAKNIITESKSLELGDVIHLIHEILNIQFQTRIVEVIDNPLHKNLKPRYTVSSKPLDFASKEAMQIVNSQNLEKEFAKTSNKQNEIDKRIEGAQQAVNEVNHIVDTVVIPEMDRIENEVIPEIEQAVENSYIPDGTEPPEEIPKSGMWLDTSVNPPRMKRWTGTDWVVLAPTEAELDDIMQQMRDDAIAQGIEYTDAEIQATRQAIINQLETEIGDVNDNITSLEDTASNLQQQANDTIELLDQHGNKIIDLTQDVDEIEGKITSSISEIERIDDTVTSNSTQIEQNKNSISQRVSSLDYERDKTGILSSIEQNTTDIETTAQGLLLMVTKEQYETDVNGIEERISSTEATLDIHAEAIELSATKEELLNYVDTQTYTSQMGELTVGIEGVTTRVSSAEAIISTHTGEIETARSQIATIDTKVDGITSTVSDLSFDLTTANQSISQIDQKADGIISTVSSIQTDLDGKASRDEAIKTVVVEYYLSTSSTTTTGGSWNVTPPDWVSGRYFWSRTKTTYSDGRVSTTDPVNITGAKGDTGARGSDGKDGRGIVSATVTYRNHTSGTAAPTSGWLSSVPSPVKGQYLWTRTVTTYTEGDPVTTYSVAYNATDGQRGADGTGISSTVVHYQIGTSGTTAPTSTWLTSPPAPIKGRYLWTRTTITYTSGSPSVSYSTSYYATDGQKGDKGDTGARGATGSTGATGQGVDSVTTQYYSSTSKTTQSGGSWVNTQPAWVKGRYLWTRTRIIYKNPTDTGYTKPVIDNAWESMTVVETKIEQLPDEINLAVTQGIGALEIGGRNLFTNTDQTMPDNYTTGTITPALSIDEWNKLRGKTVTISVFVNLENGNTSISRRRLGAEFFITYSDGSISYIGAWHYSYNTSSNYAGRVSSQRAIADKEIVSVSNLGMYIQIGGDNLEVSRPKVEIGNKATDWTPAPEDQVDKTNVLSSINLSTEGVKIEGKHIEVRGLVEFINADGSSRSMIQGGKIVGQSITANQLNINNIFGNSAVIAKIQSDSVKTATLSATKITTGTLNANNVSIINLSASVINAGTLNGNNVNVTNINASNINTGTLNTANILIHGGTTTDYTRIDGSYFESRGRFTRTWRGSTTTHDIKIRHQNGYMRARNDTLNRSLYFSDYGVSTYVDGDGQEASGTLSFFNTDYSNPRGVVLQSGLGAVSLVSDKNRIVLDANATVNIESEESSIYLRPFKKGRPGNNEFRFWIKDGTDASATDGVLTFGNSDVGQASGLRFQKSTAGTPVLWVTNGNGDIGTGRVRADRFIGDLATPASYAYVRAERLRVVQGGNNTTYSDLQLRDIQAESIRINTGVDLYLGTSTGEVRVTNNLLYNGGNTGFRPIRALDFFGGGNGDTMFRSQVSAILESGSNDVYIRSNGQARVVKSGTWNTYIPIRARDFITDTSLRDNKKDISVFGKNTLDTFRQANIYTYHRLNETGGDKLQLGMMLDEMPVETHSESSDAFALYALTSYVAKGVKDLVGVTDQHEDELKMLREKDRLQESQIIQLKQRIERLEKLVG